MSKIANIKLELSDWLYNAGIVGICKIFDQNDDYYEKHKNYIVFDESLLENFEEKYFNYFINKYEKFTSWYKIVSIEDKLINFSKDTVDEKYIEKFNKQIEYVKTKLKSASYKSGYEVIANKELDLLKEEQNLKKIKKTKKQSMEDVIPMIEEQNELLQEIIKYLKKEEVKRIIMAKNIIYDVIAKFWSDVSFLNSSNNKKSMYKEYKNYFLDDCINYIHEDKEKFKHTCFSCENKIAKLSKPASYDLTWVNKMGVDMSRKSSHFWNFYGDTFICPICNLIYSCIPAGFTILKDKGIFINENSNIDTLIKVNNTAIDNNTTFQELEEKSYFTIAENIKQSEFERSNKEIDNIQIIKLDSNNERRPYSFNVISKNKLRIIYNNRKNLRLLISKNAKIGDGSYINLYSEVIKRLYNNENLFDLISQLFYLKLGDKFKGLSYLKNIIKINNSFLGGIMGKKVYYKKIDEIQKLGFYLRKDYENKKADNKINGITYRLLNALKTKNSNRFMDTLLNAYMYIGKLIPTEFIEGLKDEAKLQTIGYAFLLGLQGDNFKLEGNEKEEVVNNE
ncbi:CRISPR-associated protein Cas8a1/Cst1 [Clostridium sporogenes]|uniref:type I-B CRISPR-associated protein Cas8b1/Cst1 n=1 Tax=Clostridium botulinum TaxID=1491 RepID=UPI0007175DC7|nr:type I-B CRISPR-associated protein Cas8b1/Cst1 [Clostridium botulinum]KRU26833.1 CRISPR-associated protein Cas8a1/Cst1 [Clostridium sporogenes]KRU29697.1 CRISPR-associated protein Cas8a1/Cst1 [Clostridium sporogenes]KRU35462.1 CRISPR-associated protein Cas8a1/Cst1 [Clostridium sporogenes]KRU49687.1 CRISPR-associated protein Cas8a1/Cst1 [Clostridium sporogenes]MBZ1328421.1 type I-B CRISPR-associated protein Cas8b1/Cst1 [Clostridium botulinum]